MRKTALVWLVSSASTLALLVVACSSQGPLEPTGLKEPTCTTDAHCQLGKYCAAGACVHDCTPNDGSCGAGKQCLTNGRCADVGTGGTAGTSGSGATGGTTIIPIPDGGMPDVMEEVDACAETKVELSTETPNVLLLVDRSGSMAKPLEADTSRWVALRAALIDPTSGLVPSVQASVNLGLALYTGPDGNNPSYVGSEESATEPDPDYIVTDVCPYLVQVPIAPNNGAAIQAAYLPASIREGSMGQTPTGESLEAALPALTSLDPALYPGRKVIVLATDGEPDLCENGNDEEGGRERSIAAVQAALDAGVTTFVISVGSEVGEDHLRELANVGQGFPADDTTERFYRAADATSLAQAFEDIVNGVRSCTFALDGMVTGDGSDGTVIVDGTTLVKDDPNGWRLNGPSEVELLGTTCELVKTGDHSIDVSFPCGVIVPIPK